MDEFKVVLKGTSIAWPKGPCLIALPYEAIDLQYLHCATHVVHSTVPACA